MAQIVVCGKEIWPERAIKLASQVRQSPLCSYFILGDERSSRILQERYIICYPTFHTLTSVGRKKLSSMSRNVAAFSCCTNVVDILSYPMSIIGSTKVGPEEKRFEIDVLRWLARDMLQLVFANTAFLKKTIY